MGEPLENSGGNERRKRSMDFKIYRGIRSYSEKASVRNIVSKIVINTDISSMSSWNINDPSWTIQIKPQGAGWNSKYILWIEIPLRINASPFDASIGWNFMFLTLELDDWMWLFQAVELLLHLFIKGGTRVITDTVEKIERNYLDVCVELKKFFQLWESALLICTRLTGSLILT